MWHGHRPVARLMAGSHAAPGPGSPKLAYAPRRPTETVLYAIGRDPLEAFLAHARESDERALPRYVEQAFRAYLRCGVFAHERGTPPHEELPMITYSQISPIFLRQSLFMNDGAAQDASPASARACSHRLLVGPAAELRAGRGIDKLDKGS